MLFDVDPDDPDEYLYSGVVAIVFEILPTYSNTPVLIHIGTGFMADNKTIITAAHVYNQDPGAEGTVLSRRAYHGVDITTSYSDLTSYLKEYAYSPIKSGIIPTSYEPVTLKNDWFIGVLQSSFYTDHYMFNCSAIDSSILWEYTYAVGYPHNYAMNMMQSNGKVTAYGVNETHIEVMNLIEVGMSGGPIYAAVNGRSCIAIICAIDPSNGYGRGTIMTQSMVDLIINTIVSHD